MRDIKYKYVTGQHLKNLEIYTKRKDFTPEKLEEKGEAYGIICKWILKIRELGMEHFIGDQIQVRKGITIFDDMQMSKHDSKKVDYYKKQVPDYRLPDKLFNSTAKLEEL